MKLRNLGAILVIFLFSACASIPKETILLSQTLGKDLQVLHKAHRNIIEIHFKKIKTEINSFVDDVYAPFVIHYVLKKEFNSFEQGKPSVYGILEIAGQKEGKMESENAVNEMADFQNAARKQIERKRKELLTPILKQESDIVMAINQSYEQAGYANATITAYLQSLRKVKDAQEEALSMIGLDGVDTLITNSLVKVSEQVEQAVEKAKDIDVKSTDAYSLLEAISNEIKDVSTKK